MPEAPGSIDKRTAAGRRSWRLATATRPPCFSRISSTVVAGLGRGGTGLDAVSLSRSIGTGRGSAVMVVAVMVMRDLIVEVDKRGAHSAPGLVDGLEGHVPAPVGSHWLLMILVLVVAGRGGARLRGHRASLRRGEPPRGSRRRRRHRTGPPPRWFAGAQAREEAGSARSMTLAHAGISIGRVGGPRVASAGPRAGRVAHLDARAGANRHHWIGLLRRPPGSYECVLSTSSSHPSSSGISTASSLVPLVPLWQPVRRRTSRGASFEYLFGGQTRASDSGVLRAK